MRFGEGSLTSMIVRNYGSMNPKLVLQAIDEILSQAKASDEKSHNNNISLGGTGGTVSFTSEYEYELFSLMPVLQRLEKAGPNHYCRKTRRSRPNCSNFRREGLMSPPAPPQPADASTKEPGAQEAAVKKELAKKQPEKKRGNNMNTYRRILWRCCHGGQDAGGPGRNNRTQNCG